MKFDSLIPQFHKSALLTLPMARLAPLLIRVAHFWLLVVGRRLPLLTLSRRLLRNSHKAQLALVLHTSSVGDIRNAGIVT